MMSPPLQPHLADDHVELRPLAAHDWHTLFAAASDPAIWAIHPSPNRWREDVFRQYFDEALASRGALAVRDAASGIVIGSSRYDSDNAEVGEIEIGWSFLARGHWGGASNRSVKRLMLAHAFAQGYRTSIFLVGRENGRSRRAMEKIGGVLTDRIKTVLREGKPSEHVAYAIAAADFACGPLMTVDDAHARAFTQAQDDRAIATR